MTAAHLIGDDDSAAPRSSLVKAGCDGRDYVGEHGNFDSAELVSQELKAISAPYDDKTSAMKVMVPAPK